MRKIILSALTVVFFAVQAEAAEYQIDADHSQVGFRIKHLAISTVPGRFTRFSGTFKFDPDRIESSSAEARISIESINTDNSKRDDHLRNPDFFDAARFPEMLFKTSRVEADGKDSFLAHGVLTIRNIAKPVTLKVTHLGAVKDPWGKERAAFSASTRINRKDFGLTWNKALETGGLVVGEDVEIQIDIQGIKQN